MRRLATQFLESYRGVAAPGHLQLYSAIASFSSLACAAVPGLVPSADGSGKASGSVKIRMRRPVVLVKLFERVLAIAVAAAVVLSLAGTAHAQQQKNWKDRAEWELYDAIVKATDPNQKLQLLDQWRQKYPQTDFQEERWLLYTQTYQQLNRAQDMWNAATELLKVNPDNIQGLYYITSLTVSMADTSPERLAMGEKCARALLDKIKTLPKPENLSDADWQKQKTAIEIVGYTTLGWVAMNRKNHTEAENYFREVLKRNPRNAQVSYWLGTVILAQRNPDKQSEAFFHLARAGHLTGEGAMTEQARKQVAEYLRKIYVGFHGDESGLQEMIQLALKEPFPPAGFVVKSKEQLELEAEEKLRRENPQLALWLNIKKLLTADNGEQYFANEMKGTKLPRLRGYLIAQEPPDRPKTLILGLSDRNTREVVLQLDQPYRYPAPAGTVLQFEGVAVSFTKQPFRLVLEASQEEVSGWPPPPQRRAPARP